MTAEEAQRIEDETPAAGDFDCCMPMSTGSGLEPKGCCHTPGGKGVDPANCHRCSVERRT